MAIKNYISKGQAQISSEKQSELDFLENQTGFFGVRISSKPLLIEVKIIINLGRGQL